MTLPLVIDGEIDSISGYGSCSDEFNIYKGSIGSISTYDGNVDISGGNIGDLYTDGSPSITISGDIIGAMEIRGIGGRLTITGGSFPGNVSIDCMYHGFKVAISGGLFGGDLNLFSNPGLIDLVFFGELELVLGDRWIESEYKAYAEYAINGTLRDGSPLSALTNCECYLNWGEEPCQQVSILVEPWSQYQANQRSLFIDTCYYKLKSLLGFSPELVRCANFFPRPSLRLCPQPQNPAWCTISQREFPISVRYGGLVKPKKTQIIYSSHSRQALQKIRCQPAAASFVTQRE